MRSPRDGVFVSRRTVLRTLAAEGNRTEEKLEGDMKSREIFIILIFCLFNKVHPLLKNRRQSLCAQILVAWKPDSRRMKFS